MTRETRQYLSRVRKAQDAILNGKGKKSASLDIDCKLDATEGKRPTITVWASIKVDDRYVCKSANIWLPRFTSEQIEAELAECSKLIGITI